MTVARDDFLPPPVNGNGQNVQTDRSLKGNAVNKPIWARERDYKQITYPRNEVGDHGPSEFASTTQDGKVESAGDEDCSRSYKKK